MKSKFLFPTWCSIVGYLLVIPGFILGYLNTIYQYKIPNFGFQLREKDEFFQSAFENYTNELVIFLVVIGLIFIAFSKSRREDELNARLRLNALYWAVMIYYLFYTIVFLFHFLFGEIPFVGEYINQINVFTPLLIFIIRFFYLKKINKGTTLGEPKFLPHSYKKIGVTLAISSFLGLMIHLRLEHYISLTFRFTYLLFIIGLVIWSFAQQRIEDEMVMQQRLESLQLAVYLNYALLLIATLIFYSLSFVFVLGFAQFSLLLFYVIRMEYVNYKDAQLLKKTEGGLSHEK